MSSNIEISYLKTGQKCTVYNIFLQSGNFTFGFNIT